MNTTTLKQWGNSHGVRLTKDVLRKAGISVGDTLYISSKDKVITLKSKSVPLEKMTLTEILNTIPKNSRREEYNYGTPVGKEIW